jgi:hypothetical protein
MVRSVSVITDQPSTSSSGRCVPEELASQHAMRSPAGAGAPALHIVLGGAAEAEH